MSQQMEHCETCEHCNHITGGACLCDHPQIRSYVVVVDVLEWGCDKYSHECPPEVSYPMMSW